MGPFLTSKLDWGGGPILTHASKVATRVQHASNPIIKYLYAVDTLDDMRTLLSVYKVLSLTALGLWIATALTVLGEGTVNAQWRI